MVARGPCARWSRNDRPALTGAGDRLRGKGVALVPLAWQHQSARHLGGGRTTKGIVSIDDWPRVNAATRPAEVALLDDACTGHVAAVAASVEHGSPPRTRPLRKAFAAEGVAASDFSRLRMRRSEGPQADQQPGQGLVSTPASSRASATRPWCTYSPRYCEKRANTPSANRRAGPSALSMGLQRAVRRVRLCIDNRMRP
jgi:hypothetical protein